MKRIIILLVWAYCGFYLPASGQNLHIGDKIPDLTIDHILNAKQKTISLSKLRGKLILVDFWNTWCSACIDGFAELDSLQKIYPNKLQVILVNSSPNEKRRAVDVVIARTKAWSPNGFNLPVVFPDTVLRSHFKFRSVPHTIWIDQEGTIVAITDKAAVTPANIARAIAGAPLNLKEKID